MLWTSCTSVSLTYVRLRIQTIMQHDPVFNDKLCATMYGDQNILAMVFDNYLYRYCITFAGNVSQTVEPEVPQIPEIVGKKNQFTN